MKSSLELVRAGAGSGKTYNLCDAVAAAVAGGLDPARIMATTFTKKAAAELKGRIQSKLLIGSDDPKANHHNADRLELAAIGTVHAVARLILSRYAVELGLSTRLDVISEQATDRVVAEQLNQLPRSGWEALVRCADRLGVDDLHKQLLAILDAKRGNQISDEDLKPQLQACAVRVCQLLSPLDHLHSASIDELKGHISDALAALDRLSNDTTNDTVSARKKLLHLQAQRFPLWGMYAEAARLKAGKKSGADAALDAIRNHAIDVRQNQRLHDDLKLFADLLADHTILIESGCQQYKTQRGLVDFTDLETLFLDALSNSDLTELIAEDFELVLVDEVQDTNPLQLAIFQAIRRIAPRNRWVGDPKQAIYSFRGTDPELVSRVWAQSKSVPMPPLAHNRRSQKGLVDFVGKVFSPLFDDAVQQPTKPGTPRGVERWLYDTKNQDQDALALASGILQLRNEGTRFGDILVLERSNAAITKLASALEQMGIPYLFESAGLLSTREGVMTLSGMRLVSDRNDSLAAATLKHFLSDPTETTPAWILERLRVLQDERSQRMSDLSIHVWKQPWDSDPDFALLESIDRKTSSPHSICQFVIEALDLPQRIAGWGDPASRCSNLDSILRHISEYEDEMLSSGKAVTLGGTILYLEQLAADGKDFKFPPLGPNAVTMMTYHKAKGLQWPVVILSGLDSNRDPNLWQTSVHGGGEDVENPLVGRALHAWTWPFGKTDSRPPMIRTGTDLENDAVASREGRAKADLEYSESLRLLYVGCTRAESKLAFAHRTGKDTWLRCLPGIDSVLDCTLEPGEHSLENIDTTFILRRLVSDTVGNVVDEVPKNWISLPVTDSALNDSSLRFHSPSRILAGASGVDVATVKSITLSGEAYFPSDTHEEDYASLGDAVHSYMASLPSLRKAGADRKRVVAEKCLAAFSVSGKLAPSVLVAVGERFTEWVNEKFPHAIWRVEVPVTASRTDGGSWKGTLDLILELPGGELVVIDHKSAPIRRANCEAKARQYIGQLDAYDEILSKHKCNVQSKWIHFPLAGVMVKVEKQ